MSLMKNIFTMPDTVYVQLGDDPDFDWDFVDAGEA